MPQRCLCPSLPHTQAEYAERQKVFKQKQVEASPAEKEYAVQLEKVTAMRHKKTEQDALEERLAAAAKASGTLELAVV